MKPIDRDTLIAGLRNVELVAVLVANEDVWRITARHGSLDIVDLGPFARLQLLLDQFKVAPTRVALGDELGARILGDDTFRETAETLLVLLDGPLAGVPVVALRARGRALVAMRPIVRVSRLSELGCVPTRSGVRHAVILADARGDFPEARRKADELAAFFGVTPAIGAAATRDVLFAASHADILHIAVHGNVGIGGGSLELYDQPVSALEIAAHGHGPELVVLSTCEAAANGEFGPSLATAFLASGSTQVIAPLRPVTDPGASELISAFYRSGGVADPARSLAHIQAELANTANVDWPNFVLFGHDICRKESP
jgi:CHAT domain-containing protein